jgi:diguanylate cyclase (GGDEF)-like protein
MEANSEELSTYQEVYGQLAVLKHIVWACTEISSDIEKLSLLFSEQVGKWVPGSHSAVWLVKENGRAEEMVRDGVPVGRDRRSELPLEAFDALRRALGDQFVVWVAQSIPDRKLFPEFEDPVLFPIKKGSRVFGFMAVDHVPKEKVDLYQLIASFAGLIFSAASLHRDVEDQRQELKSVTDLLMAQNAHMVAIHHAGLNMVKARDPEDLWHILTNCVVSEFGVRRAAGFALNEDSRELAGISVSGVSEGIEGLKLPFEAESIVRASLESGRLLSHWDQAQELVIGSIRMHQWYLFPIKGRERPLGVLVAEMEDKDLCDPVAILVSHAGMALDNLLMLEKVKELSNRDALTGLRNHRFFQEQFEVEFSKAMRYGRQLSLIVADIDDFKRVNDRYGHAFGDLVLRECARRMRENLRFSDIIARYGGEEIVVLLPDTGIDAGVTTAEKLRAVLWEQPIQGSEAVRVSISLGVATCPRPDVHSRQDLFKKADAALYQAKHAGKNRVERAD